MTTPSSTTGPPDPRRPRILIVRPSALGDVARTVPVLVSLRAAYPQARIDWLVQADFADVIRHHPALDAVVPFHRRQGVGKAWRLMRELRAAGYDMAFDMQGLARSGLFTWATRAKVRLGFANAREGGWLGYNVRHTLAVDQHTVDRMLALLAAHGLEVSDDMRLYVGAEDAAWCRQTLGDEPFAVVAPTARWLCKCWPIDRYVQVVQRLLETGLAGPRVVLLASPSEKPQLQSLLDALAGDPRVVLPQTTVGRMMAVVERASLVVCNDSAPLHVAVGFDRPIAAIFGPTNPRLVGPYRRPECVVMPDEASLLDSRAYRQRPDDQTLIAKVSLDAVWSTIEQQLAHEVDA